MIYLEMSRSEAHGGGEWAFPKCIWAPKTKKSGHTWPFWSKVREVRAGDTILHLRLHRLPSEASFVGYSTASTDGFETFKCPPKPGQWGYSKKFLRADLKDFTPFDSPIKLQEIFSSRRTQLDKYFVANKSRGEKKRRLFFVPQAGRLQCQNGAYLSDVDEELLSALFGITPSGTIVKDIAGLISVSTGEQLALIKTRNGHSIFSQKLKGLYNNKCCFPSCSVSDSRFLVASHISRWADDTERRGDFSNGLCLCLMHDKAFEIGLFTVDKNFRVFVNPEERSTHAPFDAEMKSAGGKKIFVSQNPPSLEALKEHWNRFNLRPRS